jgi:tetratricopeptide (TPR) repeat protein
MYCGGTVVIEDATRLADAKRSKNWLSLAKTAMDGGNTEEAYDYYTEVLECDLENWEAWLGKAEAAGRLSSLANFRLPEMLTDLTNAVGYGNRDGIDLRQRAAHVLSDVTIDYFTAAQEHLAEFISVPDTWNKYVHECDQMMEALVEAREYDPSENRYLEWLIFVGAGLLQGRRYSDPYDGSTRECYLPERSRVPVLQQVKTWVAELRQRDPSYQPPKIFEPSACFVVTATLGDPDHATVVLLRAFRDQIISKTNWGARILRVYSRVGPFMASQVAGSRTLRFLSRHLVIAPASAVARVFLAVQRRRTYL